MIVTTAPTGLIGSQLLDLLVESGEHVRAIVRDPDRLDGTVRKRVEVVKGSHGNQTVVRQACAGADALFWLVPPDPRATSVEEAYVAFTIPAAEAIAATEVSHVVNVSALGRGTPLAGQAGFVTASLAVDDLLASTGVALRALTMPSFMDNLTRQAPLIRERSMFTSPVSGHLRAPSCATRDVASTAARLLLDRSWEGTDEVAVLGPEDLSFNDMAATMSDVLQRPVEFQRLDPEAYKLRLVRAGMSGAMAQGMVEMALAKDAGLDTAVARTSDNSTPTTFRAWCTDVLAPMVQS